MKSPYFAKLPNLPGGTFQGFVDIAPGFLIKNLEFALPKTNMEVQKAPDNDYRPFARPN